MSQEAIVGWGDAFRMWRKLPALCAFALLVWQVILPWTLPHFVTADGPAHLYGAVAARDLIFHHSHSVYKNIYTIQRTGLPNWTTTVVLGGLTSLAGAEHTEKLFFSLLMLAGFLGLAYFARSFAPEATLWNPVLNFTLQSWFLFAGFYNFYLGMVLLPWLVAFHIRTAGRPGWRSPSMLAVGLVVAFFTHLIVAALAIVAVVAVTTWKWLAESQRNPRSLLSIIPAAILILLYVHSAPRAPHLFEFLADWRHFPHHVFLTGQGNAGVQSVLRIFVPIYIVAGIVLLTRKEWRSPRGALVFLVILSFALYLLVPDSGFGGSVVKLRFAWAVFILGCPLAVSASRLRVLNVPIALVVSFFLAQNLLATRAEALRLSDAVEPYLRAASVIPPRATFVRLNYRAPKAPSIYGYDGEARYPFFHLDSFLAARNGDVDLTDYEAPTGLFPLAFRKGPDHFRYQLWEFEGPGPGEEKTLDWIRSNFPVPVDFVVVFGDENSPASAQQGMPQMLAYLESSMQLVSTSADHLVRIYHGR